MTTYNTPITPVFNAGYGYEASDLNSLWMQTASFFQTRVVLRVSQTTTATSLPDSGAVTTIGFDNVLEDPYSGWDSGTHLWTPPAGYSAWYQATITIRTVTLADLVDLRPVFAGTYSYALTTVEGNSNAGAGVSATFVVYLVGGQDTLGAACSLLNSGSAVDTSLTAGQQSGLEIIYLSQT